MSFRRKLMLNPREIYELLSRNDIRFFAGVPDSLLKHFCSYIEGNTPLTQHVIAANEGNAIALAAGHYFATGNPGCVYMQNSGLGNAINPLISLTDPAVYGVPMLIFIGWRGEPGTKDEPQHRKQGEVTLELLDVLGVPRAILPKAPDEARSVIENAIQTMKQEKRPYAIVVRRDTFAPCPPPSREKASDLLREKALHIVLDSLSDRDVIVATTGKTSREVFEYRKAKKHGHEKDFLTVGSMGHASSIALAIALTKSERNVWCLDGDGAAIMHLGSLTVIGQKAPKNLIHVVINNGAHESVGGQPTAGFSADFCALAEGYGYKSAHRVASEGELKEYVSKIQTLTTRGPILLEIRVKQGSREDLGRPTRTPQENKEDFMRFLEEERGL